MKLDTQYLQYYFDFLFAMTEKEIKSRYKRAVFGFLWIILNPLLQMLIIGLVFSYFVKIPNYFTFLFVGLLPWQFFSLSLIKATGCFINERALLQKAIFPKECLLLSIILSNFFHVLITSFIVFILIFFTQQLSLIYALYYLVALSWLFVFVIGLSLITASLNVRFRDIAFFVQTIATLWFYATPILYNYSVISPTLQAWLQFNPLTSIFILFHTILTPHTTPTMFNLILNLIQTTVVLTLGIGIFIKESPYFVDRL